MALPALLKATGDVSSLNEFTKLACLGMTFNNGGYLDYQIQEMMKNICRLCSEMPKERNTPFSQVFIHHRVAKEFDSVNLSEWAQSLDDQMSVACCMAVRELKLYRKEHGESSLTWDKVIGVLNNCDYITKDEESCKRINDIKTFHEWSVTLIGKETNEVRKREIITWFKDLFNKHDEQAVVDNSIIVQKGILEHLAGIASECGAAIRNPATLFIACEEKSDKVMEIGVISFPKKNDAKIKAFRLVIFAFFKSARILLGQRDQAGFEVEYDSVEFRPNTYAIDTKFADKARDKLAQVDTFDF